METANHNKNVFEIFPNRRDFEEQVERAGTEMPDEKKRRKKWEVWNCQEQLNEEKRKNERQTEEKKTTNEEK